MVLLLAEQVHLDRPLEVSVTERLLQWHLVRIVERKKVAFRLVPLAFLYVIRHGGVQPEL